MYQADYFMSIFLEGVAPVIETGHPSLSNRINGAIGIVFINSSLLDQTLVLHNFKITVDACWVSAAFCKGCIFGDFFNYCIAVAWLFGYNRQNDRLHKTVQIIHRNRHIFYLVD